MDQTGCRVQPFAELCDCIFVQMWTTLRFTTGTDLDTARHALGYEPAPPRGKNAHAHYDTDLIADFDIWLATIGVSPDDPKPTGPPQRSVAAMAWQQHLDERLSAADVNVQYEARLAEDRTQIRWTRSRPRASSIAPREPRRGVDR